MRTAPNDSDPTHTFFCDYCGAVAARCRSEAEAIGTVNILVACGRWAWASHGRLLCPKCRDDADAVHEAWMRRNYEQYEGSGP